MTTHSLTTPWSNLDAATLQLDQAVEHGPSHSSTTWMTAAEAATYLRCPRKRIYNLTSRREIPHRKQEGRLLFRTDELDRWMDTFYAGPDWAGPDSKSDL